MRGTTTDYIDVDQETGISIHVPREGDDQQNISGATYEKISIHVPREGDDERPEPDHQGVRYFNPRPP